MNFLLDTHLLIWSAIYPERLPAGARDLLENPEVQPVFSVASIWEIGIKHQTQRANFALDPHVLRRGLLENRYEELPITSSHVLVVSTLPMIHKDPFDRILVAQAIAEGMELLTSDSTIIQYPGPIRRV